MLQGLRTVLYQVSDLAGARQWYQQLLGVPPYFDEEFYVGFDVGGYELGLLPTGEPDPPAAGQSYWGVESMTEAWQQVIDAGAKPLSPPTDVGEGIVVAVVVDPSGSRLGLIENPHFTARG